MASPRVLALLCLLALSVSSTVALLGGPAFERSAFNLDRILEEEPLEGSHNELEASHGQRSLLAVKYSIPANICSLIVEKSVDELQTMVAQAKLTYLVLMKCYLKRIADYSDPTTWNSTLSPYAVNAYVELNPLAIKLATTAWRKYHKWCLVGGATSPECLAVPKLFGMPVALKDNTAADPMNNTAGSFAFLGCKHKESFVATKLKNAGAIIIGKAGLSEWANFRGSSVSGWSGRNGQVYAPYVRYNLPFSLTPPSYSYNTITVRDGVNFAGYVGRYTNLFANGTYNNTRNPGIVSGSSSGSAVIAALSLAALTIGSETSGSILSPSSAQALVGIKPTVGYLSRAGVIPLSHSQDTLGPMVRSVADAAYMMDVATGADADDADSVEQILVPVPPGSFASYLKADGLVGMKIAVAPLNPHNTDPNMQAAYAAAIANLIAWGANVTVFPVTYLNATAPLTSGNFDSNVPLPGQVLPNNISGSILNSDFKVDMASYMAGCKWAPGFTPMYTLSDVIEFNIVNGAKEFQGGTACPACQTNPAYANFFQQTWHAANATLGMYDPGYLALKFETAKAAYAIAGFFKNYDVLLHMGSFTGTFARARLPSITIPFVLRATGSPAGLYFSGPAYSEKILVKAAYGYEYNLKAAGWARPLPSFCDGCACGYSSSCLDLPYPPGNSTHVTTGI